MNKYITKVRKKRDSRILQVLVNGYWETVELAIQNIENHIDKYYVKVNGQDKELGIGVQVIQGQRIKYLRTLPDGTDLDNLENLPTEYI